MQSIDPWTYPVHVKLSENQFLQDEVENIIHQYKNQSNSNVQTVILKANFLRNLISFKKHIDFYNTATKAIAGHFLHSLKKISFKMNELINTLKQNKRDDVDWTLLTQNHETLEHVWEHMNFSYLQDLNLQTTETIAKITMKGLPSEAIIILAKSLYIIEKIRHNNRKQARCSDQREQITILPWTVKDENWNEAAKYIKNRSQQIRMEKKVQFKQEMKNLEKDSQHCLSNQNVNLNVKDVANSMPIHFAKMVDITVLRDETCNLWNASKMLRDNTNYFKVKYIFKLMTCVKDGCLYKKKKKLKNFFFGLHSYIIAASFHSLRIY